MKTYFGITDALHLYDKLNEKPIEYWRKLWAQGQSTTSHFQIEPADKPPPPPPPPGALSQIRTLLNRRVLLFKRDRGYWLLTLGITIGFPLLVTISPGMVYLNYVAHPDSSSGFCSKLKTACAFGLMLWRRPLGYWVDSFPGYSANFNRSS